MLTNMRLFRKALSAAEILLLCFTSFITGQQVSAAGLLPGSAPDTKSTPELKIRIYGFPGISPQMLRAAETEAERLLRAVHVSFIWVDCTARVLPASCAASLSSEELVVRIIRRALPQASANALGMAASDSVNPAAFLFYDRMISLRTAKRLISTIVGRVLAHEITHLLLPSATHSQFGLMRAQWETDDMLTDSAACNGISASAGRLIHLEALRRVASVQPFTHR